MKKTVVLLLTASLLAGAATANAAASAYQSRITPFKDLKPSDDWAKERIYTLSAYGILSGYEDNSFRPQGTVTREEFVTLLVNTAKVQPASENSSPYTDVASGRWSYPYIQAAYDQKWLDFMQNGGKFEPARPITREEVAAMVGHYMLGTLPAAESQAWLNGEWKKEAANRSFKDAATINGSIAPLVYYTSHRGIMVGDQVGFRPKSTLIRSEAATLLNSTIREQIEDVPLTVNGFYALRSYPQIDEIPSTDKVTFGWSHLQYDGNGRASVNTTTTEYKFPTGWQEVTEKAKQHGKRKDLMVFSADDSMRDFLQDAPARKAFAESAAAVLNDSRYGFTGINIDFEGLMNEADAPAYTTFLRELKTALGGKSLAVSVPPTFYYKGYDLKNLGRIADEVVLMAYDFTHEASMLPSAPLPLVNEAVEQALHAQVPKEKLVLGIAKTAADQWTTPSPGVAAQYNAPTPDLVEKRLKMPGVLQEIGMPFFLTKITFRDTSGDNLIWYEDGNSIGQKMRLAKYYGLKGVSLWTMGALTDKDWQRVRESK